MKPFEEWSYDDLINWSTWTVMVSTAQGHKLASTMGEVYRTHIAWHKMATAKDEKKKKGDT